MNAVRFFCFSPGQMQGKTKSQGDYLRDGTRKPDKMAVEQASLSASPKPNITTSQRIFLVFLYLPHLPHMSDNIKSLCSSKVSSIKSTRGSAPKTPNVKMAKKKIKGFFPPFIFCLRRLAGGLTGPRHHGSWCESSVW